MIIVLMILHLVLHNLDEHYFNKKRDHSRLEIVSIILDGVFFLIPILFATFVDFDEKWVLPYKVAGAISMISIVKNEIFYKNLCTKERLTHACLYVLHPMLLFSFYESWRNDYFNSHPNFWMFQIAYVALGVRMVTYQLIYWNYIHEKKEA